MEHQVLSPNTFTVQQVKQGVECRWSRTRLILYSVILAIITVLLAVSFILLSRFDSISFRTTFEIVLIVVIMEPCLIFAVVYYAVSYWGTVRCVGRCPIYRVTLSKPSMSFWYKRAAIFILEIHTDKGVVHAKTYPIFTNRMIDVAAFDKYVNQDVYVYYDAQSNKVHVIDLVEKYSDIGESV